MFVDVAKISVKAGNGGDGAVAFHREKYVPAGGPDGGDGGRGGNVVFQMDESLSTLIDFRYKKNYAAQDGDPGRGRKMNGKSGEDLVIKVPKGTLIRDAETGRLMADVSTPEPVILLKGGNGGWGNSHFATPTRQAPRFSKGGLPGQKADLLLELKLLADVGLVGFPNVGKSTLISVVSGARPKIDNYHFTTLSPSLGVVRVDEGRSFVMADIPGLIEGASEGMGMGHEFLRHVDRCRLLLHVVDVAGVEGRDPKEDFLLINSELKKYHPELADRPMIVAGNKSDVATPEQLESFAEFMKEQGYPYYPISAATKQGTKELMDAISNRLSDLPPTLIYEPDEVLEEEIEDKKNHDFTIHKEDDVYVVDAPWMSRVLSNSNMDDYESLQYFQRALMTSGIIDKLKEMGVQDGDTVQIEDFEFEYVE